MPGVAVGAGTRAFREGIRPGAGPGVITGTPGRFGAVGTGTRAFRSGLGSPQTPQPPWSPPPIPAGQYNPELDVREAEGKQGSQQAQSGYERERTNAENNYATSLSVLGEREGNETRADNEALSRLSESYQRLGAKQGEQANASGTLYGGALIASAQKRAANEGREKAADQAKFAEQHQSDENERGHLSVGLGQLLGPGGSLTEAMQNLGAKENTFEQGINTLKTSEAASRGYEAPTAPTPHVNPLTGQSYRVEQRGGKTVHVYAGGRKVVVG